MAQPAAAQLAEFEQIVLGCLSIHNEIRPVAEATLTKMRSEQPAAFMMGLLALLRESQQPQAREFAAVILRQNLLVNSSSPVWKSLPRDVQAQIQSGLLFLFQNEPNPSLRRKITDAVAATATRISGKVAVDLRTDESGRARTQAQQQASAQVAPAEQITPWPELMPTVLQLASANNPAARESLCNLINKLSEFNPDMLTPHLAACKAIIVGGMKDANMDTRLSGLRACVSLLSALSAANREHMKDTVPLMFEILGAAFQEADEDTIKQAVTVLSDLAELKQENEEGDFSPVSAVAGGAKFLKGHIKQILAAMVMMASSDRLDGETRRVCLAFLLILAEEGKGMIRKVGEFAAQVVPLAFSFMTELEESAEWSDADAVDAQDDDEGFENYKFGSEAIERLAHALGGKLFLQVTTPLIQRALQEQRWQSRHAALIGMARMAIGCDRHLEAHLDNIMRAYVAPFALNDPHPRVRWAAVNLLAHLCQAFEPDFANDHAPKIMEILMACMQPSNHWRVIHTACLCFPDFCRGLDKEKLMPFAQAYLQLLVPLLGMLQYRKVVEGALVAVSTVAAVLEEDFIPFYDGFMPGVVGLLQSCQSDKDKGVRAKAIECIGMLAQAVGEEKFRPQLVPIMESLLGMLAANLPADDPQHAHVVTTMARICRAVGQAFVPFLPRVMPPLLQSARINDACVIVNEGEHNAYADRAGWTTQTVELRAIGTQQLSLNTSLLEEKSLAIRLLFEYANTLGGSFYPYLADSVAILVPSVRYQFNPQVREHAVYSLAPLLRCLKEALANDPARNQRCVELFELMWPQVVEGMKVESDLEFLGDIVDAFKDCIELMPVPLKPEQVNELNQLLLRLVSELLQRCRDRDQAAQSDDHDEAQQELFDLENEAEDEFLGNIYRIVNAMVKNTKEAYMQSFHEHLYPVFHAMMQSDDVSLRTSGICVISQVMEDVPSHPLSTQYSGDLHKLCVESADSDDASLKQSCMFGLGVCAMVLKHAYASQAPQVLQLLLGVANAPADAEESIVTDNAVSSIAKLYSHVYDAAPNCPPEVAAIMGRWASFLPCDGDTLEAQKIHAMLVSYVAANNGAVIGANMANMPQILRVFAQLLAREEWEEILLPETRESILAILQQLQAGMPQDQLRALFQAVPEQHREALRPFVNAQLL